MGNEVQKSKKGVSLQQQFDALVAEMEELREENADLANKLKAGEPSREQLADAHRRGALQEARTWRKELSDYVLAMPSPEEQTTAFDILNDTKDRFKTWANTAISLHRRDREEISNLRNFLHSLIEPDDHPLLRTSTCAMIRKKIREFVLGDEAAVTEEIEPSKDVKTKETETPDEEPLPMPPSGSVWVHCKGGVYEVKAVLVNEKDMELMVAYHIVVPEGAKPDVFWVRPLKEFLGSTLDGTPRFQFVGVLRDYLR